MVVIHIAIDFILAMDYTVVVSDKINERVGMKINIKDKVALGLFAAALLFNPLGNQYVVAMVDRALMFVSREAGVYITLGTAFYLIGYILYNMWSSREKTNIPKKSAKTLKAGKFLTT